MSISDEQFDQTLYNLQRMDMDVTAAAIRARDSAQREALGAAIEGAMKWEQDLKDAREALARVEAERDSAQLSVELWKEQYQSVVDCGNEIMAERDTAQAQLAEVLALYQQIRHIVVDNANCDQSGKYHTIDDAFMAIAQAEQQEARNAEVARESLRPENQRIEPVEPLRVPHPLEAQGAQAGDGKEVSDAYWRGWNDRAALATQTAAEVKS